MRKPQTPEKKQEMIRIGERLYKIRKEAGLSLSDVAERLNRDFGANTNKGMISKYENGIHEPSASTLYCMSRIFNVSVDYITCKSDVKFEQQLTQGVEASSYCLKLYDSMIDYNNGTQDLSSSIMIPSEWLVGGREFFAYRVHGGRFAPRYYDGDIVIFERKVKAKKDQIALVSIAGENAFLAMITKKREGKIITPLDPALEGKFYSTEELAKLPVNIVGLAVELRRQEFEI